MAKFSCFQSILRKTSVLLTAAAVFSCVALPDQAMAQGGAGWETINIGKNEYVSVDSLKKFYNFNNLKRSGDSIVLENALVKMNLQVGSSECLMNNMKFIFSNPVKSQGSKAYVSRLDLAKLIDPVLRPNFISNAGNFRTVILDPGHGGKDPGSTNSLGTEAEYNLKLAQATKALLEAENFRVIMTRNSNEFISLQGRVDVANAVREDAIFISLHFNSGGRSARGIETFTLSPPGVAHYGRGVVAADSISRAGNEHDSANIALATAVHGTVLTYFRKSGVNSFDRGVKRARFSVLSGVRHPAILFEGGFLSNPYEAKLINSKGYQDLLAKGVVDAVRRYRYSVGRATAGNS